MRVRGGALLVVVGLLTTGCIGFDDQAAPEPSAPVMVAEDGVLVRGSVATVRFSGLDATAGEPVQLIVETAASAQGRYGYWEAGTGTVLDDGSLTVALEVPNALSGEDDVMELKPGTAYPLTVRSTGDPGLVDTLSIVIESAQVGVAYAVLAQLGSPDCGGPAVEIRFDGRLWTPVSEGNLDVPASGVEGRFTLASVDEGSFITGEDATVGFEVVPAYAC